MGYVEVVKMKKLVAPCNGCTERNAFCHPTCKLYAEYKKQKDAENKKLYIEKHIDVIVNDCRFNRIEKLKNKRGII